MATKKLEPAEDTTTEQPISDTPNGVFVTKVKDKDGNISTEVAPVGEVLPTEVQTLLELGVKRWRAQIGLNA